MAYNSGTINFVLTSTGLQPAQAAAKSINQNMTQAAAAASALGKTGTAGLQQANKAVRGTFGESVAYGQARGNTGQTGAGARDFSNQVQGLGGLVRLYATFAANIFAVGMAFEALKKSFQFEQLQKASDAFAISTGKNLSGVAKDLQKLSQGVLTDKSAQQISNYGASAGFTADQMKRLVGVARGASQALGRDMNDAIDRLMRGTGKLNPELLDELGLLTRVKPAYEEYAKQIGKTATTLSGFEKTQAFINAVLKEGEEKFGAVSKAVDSSPFERFTASLLSMGTAVGGVVNKILVPILDFFSTNSAALIGAMALAFGKLLLTALPALNTIGQTAKRIAVEQADSLKKLRDSSKSAYTEIANAQITAATNAGAAAKSQASLQKDLMKEFNENSKKSALAHIANHKSASATIKQISQQGFVDDKTLAQARTTDPANLAYLQKYKAERLDYVEASKEVSKQDAIAAAAQAKVNSVVKDGVAAQGALNKVLLARAELRSVKTTELARVEDVARVGTMSQAFNTLGYAMDSVRSKYQELHPKTGLLNNAMANLHVAGTAVSGTFRIMTVAVSSALSVLSPWIMAIGLAVFAIDALIGVFGGWSKKIDEVKSSQEGVAKSLELIGSQAVKFTELQKAADGTAASFVRLQEYSSGIAIGIQEGLSKSTAAFLEFNSEIGGSFSKMWDDIKSMWGGDVLTKQVSQLRSSIYSILATTSSEDSEKVQKAILSALPSATSISDLTAKLQALTSAQIAEFGVTLSKNLGQINLQLKAGVENLKASDSAWKSLGESVDTYNKKAEVKDPKLKDIVRDLQSINNAYKAAITEQEKAKVLSGIDVETQDKLVKLAKERGIAIQDWVKWIEEARSASARYAADEKIAAEKRKAEEESKAASFLKEGAELQKLTARADMLKAKLDAAKGTGNMGVIDQLGRAMADVQKDILSILKDGIKESADAGQPISQKVLENHKLLLEKMFDEFNAQMEASTKRGMANMSEMVLNASTSGAALGKLQDIFGPSKPQFNEGRDDKLKNPSPSTIKDKPPKTPGENLADKFAEAAAQHAAKMSKYHEFALKAAGELLNIRKEMVSVEQSILGYATTASIEGVKQASINVAHLTYRKEIAQLEHDAAKASKDKNALNAAAAKLNITAKEVAAQQLFYAEQSASAEKIKSEFASRKSQYEKEYVKIAQDALDTQNSALDIATRNNVLSVAGSEVLKAQNTYQKESITLKSQEFALQNSIEALKTQSTEANDNVKRIQGLITVAKDEELELLKAQLPAAKELAAEYDKSLKRVLELTPVQQRLIDLARERRGLELAIAEEEAKQKQVLLQINTVASAMGNILNAQLKNITLIASAAANSVKSRSIEKAMVLEIAKSYNDRVKAAGLANDEDAIAILQQEAVLELSDKIYENRLRLYQLNAKDGSGADVMKTIGEGFQIEADKFKSTVKSTVQTVIDGTLAAIDAPIDYIVETLKGNGKINFKELAKSIGDSLTASVYEAAGNNLKVWARDFISKMFGQTIALNKEEIQKEATAALKTQTNVLKDLTLAIQTNTNALNNNANKVLALQGGMPAGMSKDSTNEWMSGIMDVTQYSNKAGRALDGASGSAENFSGWLGYAGNAVANWANSLPGGIGGTATGAAGAILGGGADGLTNWASNIVTSTALSAVGTFATAAYAGYAATVASNVALGASAGAAAAGVGASATGGALMGGLSAGLAAVPVVGWIALAAILIWGIVTGMEEGDAMRTGIWSSKKVNNSDPSQHGESAFGAFGIRSSEWFSTEEMGEQFKVLTDAITNLDNGISAIVGQTVTAAISTALANSPDKKYNFGMERTDFTQSGVAGQIIIDRYTLVLNTIEAGLGNLLQGFEGTGAELGNFIVGLVAMNKTLHDVNLMTRTFGEVFDINAVKAQQKEGEFLTETFDRLANTFNITTAFVRLFGLDIETVFGEIGLAGLQLRETMVAAAGGLEQLNQKSTFYFEQFFTASQRNILAITNANSILTQGFGTLNMAIPKTRAEFTALMKAATESGNFDLVNSLLDLAPAMDSILDVAEALIADTDKLNEALHLLGITVSSEFTQALNDANISIDKFINDTQAFSQKMLTSAQKTALAYKASVTTLNDSESGYTAKTGRALPVSREQLLAQWEAETDPVKKAIIVSFTESFDTIFSVQEDLAEALKLTGITMSVDFVDALTEAGISVGLFLDNLTSFTNTMMTPSQRESFSLDTANSSISGYSAATGLETPASRAEYFEQWRTAMESGNTTLAASILSFTKFFDVVFTYADKLKSLGNSLEKAGLKLDDGLVTALATAGTSIEDFTSQVEVFNSKFVSDSDRVQNAAKTGRQTIVDSGYEGVIPKTRAAFLAMMQSADATTKVLLMKLVPAFDAIYTAAEAWATRVGAAMSSLFSTTELDMIALNDANAELNAGFASLGVAIPATRDDFVAMYNAAVAAGNTNLASALLNLSPAFAKVTNAVRAAAEALSQALQEISSSAASFIDEIQSSIYTPEQMYNKYKSASETASDEIDKIALLSQEDLQSRVDSGLVSVESVKQLYQTAEDNARKAWAQLDESQKLILGPQFIAYIQALEKNASDQIARVAGVTATSPTVLDTSTPEEILAKIPKEIGKELRDAGDYMANVIKDGMRSALKELTLNDDKDFGGADLGTNYGPVQQYGSGSHRTAPGRGLTGPGSIGDPNSISLGTAENNPNVNTSGNVSNGSLSVIVTNMVTGITENNAQLKTNLDQQQTNIAETAGKLLAAAEKMWEAAVGQLDAANTTQKIQVDVDLHGLASGPTEV